MNRPGRFLVVTWDGGGNTPSAYNLSARLADRGHEVLLLGWESMTERAAASDVRFRPYPSVPPLPAGVPHETVWDALTDALWGDACRGDIVAAAQDLDADVLVVDCMMRAGFDAARELRLPTAALVHVSYEQFAHGWGSLAMETDVFTMLAQADCALALQPPGFDPPCALADGTIYVGAVLAPKRPPLDVRIERLLKAPGDPWVLLSLSTTSQAGQSQALAAVLDELADEPVRVLLTLGGAVAPGELALPGNVMAIGFTPHEQLLPHVDAVVCHAGMSTIAMALGVGRPLVCLPQGRDQHDNATRVVDSGAGLLAAPGGAAAALRAVLEQEQYRLAAGAFARACAPLGEGAVAADLVEALHR